MKIGMPTLKLNLELLCRSGGNIAKKTPNEPKLIAIKKKIFSGIRVLVFMANNLSTHIKL